MKRLFYVIGSPDINDEIYATKEIAYEQYNELLKKDKKAYLKICEVDNAYKDNGGWNYDDYGQPETFNTISYLKGGK